MGIPRARLHAPLWRRALAWIMYRAITARCAKCARHAGHMPRHLLEMFHDAHLEVEKWERRVREHPLP